MMMSVSTGFPPFYLKTKRRAYIEDGEGGNDVRHEGELHTHCNDADDQAGGILPHTLFTQYDGNDARTRLLLESNDVNAHEGDEDDDKERAAP